MYLIFLFVSLWVNIINTLMHARLYNTIHNLYKLNHIRLFSFLVTFAQLLSQK